MNKNQRALLLLLILVAAISAYLPSFSNDFIWDDYHLVVNDENIRSFGNIPALFKTHLYYNSGGSNFYRPVQSLSYMADYALWGLKPFGYHITNLLFHLLTVILVYLFVSRILKNAQAGILSALIFALHPVNTEAVTYIAGRADPLSAFLFLGSILLYGKFREGADKNIILFLGSVLCFLASLFTKESVLVLPLVLILYDALILKKGPVNKKTLLIYMPYFFIVIAYVVFRLFVLGLPSGIGGSPLLNQLLLTTPKIMVLYGWLMLFPVHLHMERLEPVVSSFRDPQAIAAMVALIGILWLSAIFYRRSKRVFFCICFFFLTLLPMLNILVINAPMAEHWLYIPSIGAYAIIALWLAKAWDIKKPLAGQPSAARVVFFIFVGFMVFFMVRTVVRNIEWGRPFEFYESIIKNAPDSARGHYNMGTLYAGLGDHEKAKGEFILGIKANPANPFGYHYLGMLDYREGKKREAVKNWRIALDLSPFYKSTREVMKKYLHLDNKKFLKLRRAISVNPKNTMAYYKLARVYFENGLYVEAISVLDKLLEIKPGYADAIFNRAWLYSKLGLYEKAISEYRSLLLITPRDPDIYENLGFCCEAVNRPRDAEDARRMALELRAENVIHGYEITQKSSAPADV